MTAAPRQVRSSVAELDEMIVRAEAACARYRHAAAATGLSPLAARMRRDRWQAMEKDPGAPAGATGSP